MKKFYAVLFISILAEFAVGQNADKRLIDSYITTSDSLGNISEYRTAIVYRKKALNLLQTQTPVPYSKLVSTYRSIGFYYRKWGKYPESLKHQNKALEIALSNLPSDHPELAKAYNGLGAYHYALQDYNKSLECFENALQIGISNDSQNLGDYYNNIGISQQGLGLSSDALITYNKALKYNLETVGLFNSNTADNYENLGTLLFNIDEYDSALLHLDTAELILDSVLSENSPYIASVYNNKGVVYNAKGDSRNALKYFSQSLNLYEKFGLNNHPEIANIYSNLGLLLQEKGDWDAALSFFNRALEIRKANFGEISPKVARTHLYLGNCFLEKKFFEESFNELTTSLTIFKQIPDVAPSELIDVLNGLGAYYEKINNSSEALKHYNEALNAGNYQKANDPDFASSYARIGKVLLSKNEHQNAKSYFDKALQIRLQVFGQYHPEVAETYRLLSLTCQMDKNCQSDYIQKALNAVNFNIDAEEVAFEKCSFPLYLLNILHTWSKGLNSIYNKSKSTDLLLEADRINMLALSLIDHIKTSLEQPGSRLALLDNYYLVYENTIFVKYKLHEITNNKKYWHDAFQVAEQSNAILLMESIQSVDAEKFAGIPDSLIKKERALRIELSLEEKRLHEEQLKLGKANQKALGKINQNIFRLQRAQRQLVMEIKEKYNDYFQLKYEQKSIDVNTIQKQLLRPDQSLISYFVGEENIFSFIISVGQFEVVHIKKDIPLEVWVEEFRNSIYSFNPANNQSAYLNQKLANLGYELYQLVFEPIRPYLKTESLIIIPGGVLGYLPFDALLEHPADSYNDFDSFAYLINKYSISYCYSATLLHDMKKGHHRKSPFIAFAPIYYGDTLNVSRSDDPWRAVLGQLRFNVQEAQQIHEIMDGELYIGSVATESMFVEKAPKAGIIHLATHGKSDDRNGEYSYLAFYQTADSIENELLFVKNLYNMKIPASMVVLSACETGIGEFQRGEGIVSLARGFSFAGAASIVTTLWSIDDNASANIMVDFYKNLKNRQPKDLALRNSKLNYIKNNRGNNRTHPLFWAAFVPVGNMEPIDTSIAIWPFILGLLVVSAFLYLRFNRKAKMN